MKSRPTKSLSMTSLSSTAAAALILFALAACAPEAQTESDGGSSADDTSSDDTSSGDTGTEDTSTDDTSGGFAGVTLPGTGSYAVPAEAPIGGYELPDNQDSLPGGCTWSLRDSSGDVVAESTGPFVFVTEATATFTSSGCPDWVQFE